MTDPVLSGNPEDLPGDPEGVAKMLGTTIETDVPAETAEEPATGATASAKIEGEPGKKEEPAGVVTKDGKHVLPYSELVTARTKAREANERAGVEAKARQEAEAKATTLEGQLAELNAHKADVVKGEQTEEQFDEMIVALEKELPAIAKIMRTARDADKSQIAALSDGIKALEGKLGEIQGTVGAVAKREQVSVEQMVDEAVDANAKMRYLRDQKPELYDAAVDLDEALRGTALYKNLEPSAENFGKRFAAVVAAIEQHYGAIELPPEYQPADQVIKDAQKKVAAAGDFKPNTLSDLPGGVSPSGKPATEAMSAAQLNLAMQNMNDDQISDVLSRVA